MVKQCLCKECYKLVTLSEQICVRFTSVSIKHVVMEVQDKNSPPIECRLCPRRPELKRATILTRHRKLMDHNLMMMHSKGDVLEDALLGVGLPSIPTSDSEGDSLDDLIDYAAAKLLPKTSVSPHAGAGSPSSQLDYVIEGLSPISAISTHAAAGLSDDLKYFAAISQHAAAGSSDGLLDCLGGGLPPIPIISLHPGTASSADPLDYAAGGLPPMHIIPLHSGGTSPGGLLDYAGGGLSPIPIMSLHPAGAGSPGGLLDYAGGGLPSMIFKSLHAAGAASAGGLLDYAGGGMSSMPTTSPHAGAGPSKPDTSLPGGNRQARSKKKLKRSKK